MKRNKILITAFLCVLIVVTAMPLQAETDTEITQKNFEQINAMTLEEKKSIKGLALSGDIENINSLISCLESFDSLTDLVLSNVNFSSGDIDLNNFIDTVTLLDVSRNNKIKTISMSSNKSIEKFLAESCENLENIEVKNNTVIKFLNVSLTQLASLDATGCTNLESLFLASCDVTNKSFSIEDCSNLKELDFSGNALLRFDYEKENLPFLEKLSCDNQVVLVDWKPSGKTFNIGVIFRADLLANEDIDFSKVTNIQGTDENGNTLTAVSYDDTNGRVELSGVPYSITYEYDTGFNNTLMKVTVYASGTADNHIDSREYGGCNSAFAAFTLSAVIPLLIIKKKR